MKISSYYCNSTKILRLIRERNDLAGKTVHPVRVSNENNPLLVTKFRISQNLSNFDCDVADAIYTIYQNGYGSFTPGQVLRVLSGDDSQTIVKRNKQSIIDSIEALRSTKIEIDCTDEMKARNIDVGRIDKAPFLAAQEINSKQRYLIPLRIEYSNIKAEKYPDFFMPLYRYAEMLKQFNSFPQKLLHDDAPTSESHMSNTLETIQIKRYLIRVLEPERNKQQRMRDGEEAEPLLHDVKHRKTHIYKHYKPIVYVRNPKKKGCSIDGMLADLGIYRKESESAESWKHKRYRIHNKVVNILDYYKRIGYITDYEVMWNRNAIHGVKICGDVNYPVDGE